MITSNELTGMSSLISWIKEEDGQCEYRWGGKRRKRRDRERKEKGINKCTLHTEQAGVLRN
jgi:hypothetical protein